MPSVSTHWGDTLVCGSLQQDYVNAQYAIVMTIQEYHLITTRRKISRYTDIAVFRVVAELLWLRSRAVSSIISRRRRLSFGDEIETRVARAAYGEYCNRMNHQ